MGNVFKVIERARNLKRSKFDLSHDVKTTTRFGKLTPVYLQEVLPGDSFRMNSEVFIRVAPMLAPVMHQVNVFLHFYFVPNRLVWDEWEDLATGGRDGSLKPVIPYAEYSEEYEGMFMKKSLGDYLGLPVLEAMPTDPIQGKIQALPFRAYLKIYDDYYRDPNIEDELQIEKTGGLISTAEANKYSSLRVRAWDKDYFTSALPWPQRGTPLNTIGKGYIKEGADDSYYRETDISVDGDYSDQNYPSLNLNDDGDGLYKVEANDGSTSKRIGKFRNLQPGAHITDVNVDINELRKSIQVQKWLERSARGGYRYIEQILSHFGVMSSDKRLQRAEYLGGGIQPIVMSEVLNTAGYNVPQGDMSGHGISVGNTHRFKRFFEEHGFVIGIMSIVPKASYSQGIHRMWFREDKFDYFWPEFAGLGEQAILNKELYWDPNNYTVGDMEGTFGYQMRYAEYRYNQSKITGEFRNDLEYWHLGRKFDNLPTLNSQFLHVEDNTRIFPVELETVDQFYVQVVHHISAKRPMPYIGVPKL